MPLHIRTSDFDLQGEALAGNPIIIKPILLHDNVEVLRLGNLGNMHFIAVIREAGEGRVQIQAEDQKVEEADDNIEQVEDLVSPNSTEYPLYGNDINYMLDNVVGESSRDSYCKHCIIL